MISYTTTSGFTSNTLSRAGDYILWYAKAFSIDKVPSNVHLEQSPLDGPKQNTTKLNCLMELGGR